MTRTIRVPTARAAKLSPPKPKKQPGNRANLQGDNGLPICIGTMGFHKMTGKLYPLRCKRWDCPTCAKLNSLDLAIRVVEGIKQFRRQGRQLQFITLTAWGRYTANPQLAYTELPKWWDTFRKKIQRAAKKRGEAKPEYAAFIEVQKRGVPHLHAIVTMPGMSKRAFKQWAISSGWAHQADIEPVKSSAAGWYVAKYVSKGGGQEVGDKALPKGYRRVRFSQLWPEVARPTPSGELLVKEPKETYVEFAHRAFAAIPTMTVSAAMRAIENLLNAGGDELTFDEYQSMIDTSAKP